MPFADGSFAAYGNNTNAVEISSTMSANVDKGHEVLTNGLLSLLYSLYTIGSKDHANPSFPRFILSSSLHR